MLLRYAGLAVLALAGITCRDANPLAPGLPTRASLAVAPAFERPSLRREAAPAGVFGALKSVHGALVPAGGGTAYEVSADFVGDTARLVFDVAFPGQSQRYVLFLSATDSAGDTLFRSTEDVVARPGANAPLEPLLTYVAPDTAVRFLDVSASDTLLTIGDSLAVSASGYDASRQAVSPVRVAWTLRDTSGASLSARSGSTARLFGGRSDDDLWVVAAAFNGTTDSVRVHVRVATARVQLSADTLRMFEGDFATVSAYAYDAGDALLDREVSWQSLDPTVASVSVGLPQLASPARSGFSSSSYAQVIAHVAGTTRVVAKSGGKMDTVVVVVTPVPVAVVVVTPDSAALLPGKQIRFTAEPRDQLGNPLAGRPVVWSSSDDLIVSVGADGTATAMAAGVATVSATVEGVPGSASVRVDSVPVNIVRTTVSPSTIELRAIGALTQLSAASYAADSSLAPGQHTWSVIPGSSVTVDPLGAVTAVSVGSAWVRVTEQGGTSDSALVTVTQVPVSVTVTPPSITVDAVGLTVVYRASVADSLGSSIPSPQLSWSVDAPTVAQIELADADSAVVRALASGMTKVVARSGTASGGAELVVNQLAKSATLGPPTLTLGAGGRGRLVPTLLDANGSAMPFAWKEVEWVDEGKNGVIAIDSVGEVLATAFGATTVHAVVQGIPTAPVTVTVSDNAPAVITFSIDTLTLTGSATLTVYLSVASQGAVQVALTDSAKLLLLEPDTLVFDKTTRMDVKLTRIADGITKLDASDVGRVYTPATMTVAVGTKLPPPDKSPAPPPPSGLVAPPKRRQ